MSKNILIVDDDPNIREVIRFALDKAGMVAILAKDGREAIELFRKHSPNLMVLDINMPEMDGLEVCRELRKSSDIPIIFLSSREDEIDRVLGLEIGGDDYVTKPFSPRELVARVNVVLKRVQGLSPKENSTINPLLSGLISMDINGHQVHWNNKPITLTATEFALLRAFLETPGKVFSRDDLIDNAYTDNLNVSDRTIDSHIRRVRSKFADLGCEAVIDTVHGVGYKLGKVSEEKPTN
jgi:two-component system OmpR family response regulator